MGTIGPGELLILALVAVPVLFVIGLVVFLVIVLTKPRARPCPQCGLPNTRAGERCPRCGA